MKAYCKICAVLLLLALALPLLVACEEGGTPQPYDSGTHAHSFSNEWYDVTPPEGEPITEEVHYCRICHAAETRPKAAE
ncbi:MAG: hypothetical protein IKM08_04520 [Clostridia bacterium]|nr:hypothetical protein [Clostridia bacterium]